MSEKRRRVVVRSDEEAAAFLAAEIGQICAHAIAARGYATIALSGGRTPKTVYPALAKRLGSSFAGRLFVFLVDERFVPPEHPDSNYRMIRESFLAPAGIPAAQVYTVPFAASAAEAARSYEEAMSAFFRQKGQALPVFDSVLLGIGEDGHTASLFPATGATDEQTRQVIAVTPARAPHERITLTLRALNNARHVFVLATGPSKAAILREVFAGGPSRALPVSLVRPVDGTLTFVLDEGSAAGKGDLP